MNKHHGDNMDFFCTTLDSNGVILDINCSPEVTRRYPELTRENLVGKRMDQLVINEDALLLSMHLDIARRFGVAQSPVYQMTASTDLSGPCISVSSRSQLIRTGTSLKPPQNEMDKDDLIFCDNAILSPPTARTEEAKADETKVEPASAESQMLPWTFVFSRECVTPSPKYYVFPNQLRAMPEYTSCFFETSAWQPQPWTDINISTWQTKKTAPQILF